MECASAQRPPPHLPRHDDSDSERSGRPKEPSAASSFLQARSLQMLNAVYLRSAGFCEPVCTLCAFSAVSRKGPKRGNLVGWALRAVWIGMGRSTAGAGDASASEIGLQDCPKKGQKRDNVGTCQSTRNTATRSVCEYEDAYEDACEDDAMRRTTVSADAAAFAGCKRWELH